jgi:hypothetical protein
MKLETVELKCVDCGKKFLSPSFSDFDYGVFIFSGEKGNVFGYFKAAESPVWNFIESIIKNKVSVQKAEIDYGKRIQDACAHFAGTIKGQHLLSHWVCPRCYSPNIETGHHLTDAIEVLEVNHAEFLSLPEPIRRQKVLEFYESSFLRDSAEAMFKDMDQQEST